jgi:hypothetical protein
MDDHNNRSKNGSSHRNGKSYKRKPANAARENASAPEDAVEQFRRFLAEMIARQIAAERNAPRPPSGDAQQ